MTSGLHVVTGATGLIGSHVAERLLARGERVRALARPGSDTRFLEARGAEIIRGDLHAPDSLAAAVRGAAIVYHCAAVVGDWGPWAIYRRAIVEATGHLLAACRAATVPRLLHVSSINVYGHPRLPPERWLTEDDPLGQNLWWWDHYCRAKVLAEEQVRAHPGAWTIVRPSWTYGPRDRNSIPRVLDAVEKRRAVIVGRGDNRLNVLHAADVAEGVLRAAASPRAVGQAYNLSSEGEISQREFLDGLTALLGVPPITRRVPFWLAFTGGFLSESAGRLFGLSRPVLTRYAVALIGRTTRFSIAKARDQLGWRPTIHPLDGIRAVLPDYRPVTPAPAPAR